MDESLIAAVPLFSALDVEDQHQLAAMMSEVVFRRGEKLFNEGDPGDRLYLLVEGKVKLRSMRAHPGLRKDGVRGALTLDWKLKTQTKADVERTMRDAIEFHLDGIT